MQNDLKDKSWKSYSTGSSVATNSNRRTNSNIIQLQIQIAKVKVLQNLIASREELSYQNSKDLVDQSDIASPGTDDKTKQKQNSLVKTLPCIREVCTVYKWSQWEISLTEYFNDSFNTKLSQTASI